MPGTTVVQTPFLRHFLLFYGSVSLHLHPITRHNQISGYLRLAFNIAFLLLFNWVYSFPSKTRESYISAASHRKPLVRLWLTIIDDTFRPLFTLLTLYTFLFGPKIVVLLDKSNVLFESSISNRKSRLFILCCLSYDLFTFYWSRLYVFHSGGKHPIFSKNNREATVACIRLFVQLIAHMRSAVFFRLITYGKWATWRSLKRIKMSDKQKFVNLVKLNQRLNLLLSFPLLVQVLLFSIISVWSICFNELFSARQAVFFLLPAINILLLDYFQRKIINDLKISDFTQKFEQDNSRELTRGKNRLIYWHQAADIYYNDFHFTLFNLTTIDRQFALTLSLLLAYYSMLINQTS